MSLLDRFVIAPLSPRWAAKRAQWRKLLAYYEAAQPSRTRKSTKSTRSANAENERAAMSLRAQARHLEENLDIASGALDVLVNNIVGAGIQPEPQVETVGGELADDFNRALLKLWDDWIHAPEVTRQLDYYSLQQLACRSWLRDGEVFAQHIIGVNSRLDHRTAVPYSLEVLEADFVPMDSMSLADGVYQGIEVNEWGAPRAYRVYKRHPGDSMTLMAETKRVPAERMVHLKFAKRLHQLRGVSIFAPVLVRLEDIKEIDESERVAARVAAAMAGFIKKGTPDMYEPPEVGADGKPQPRQMEFIPGMVFDDLVPGEEVGTINPNRPNNALIPFRDSQLRSAAAGFGTSYSSLSKNYDGTYSAQRQELVEQMVNYRRLSGHFVFRWCQPVWDAFIDAVRASNAIRLPPDLDLATIYNATHTVPPMPWIDPIKEIRANEIAESRGYKSRSRIIRESGQNPDQVNREILKDQQERERLGLRLGPAGQAEPVQAPAPLPDDQDDPDAPRREE
jgi:lambda family phage portal protein